jgi:hypothetical protein
MSDYQDLLQDELFLLVGYLLNSARGLYDEPPGYGPFRLMDAAGRLLQLMEKASLSNPFLVELRQAIDEQRFSSGDDQALRAFLEQSCLDYAAQFRR